ncbi:nitrous oxide reductase family maturation protein NosD [Flavobacterium crocinum]|uniref:Nitrous oxide reductase family maturation protein NosD n=1 Tax=Flavobacterium crocinum TaxID=2183896 RepID=A0A2S1YQ48_9FLAO|nr:nitrous oxide reductase family maturation protein NosD [Flavobacterium crocinum]AWK06181.1 nitrous oxide reductase family maturation protein NosD [Flavobacterium crocinum]
MKFHICLSLLLFFNCLWSQKIEVGSDKSVKTIKKAIELAKSGDTIIVNKGIYREGNIIIDKKLILQGKGLPVLDGQQKYEVVSIKADSVIFSGFKVINSGYASLNDPCGIKIYDKIGVVVKDNVLDNNFFGIYVQKGSNCIVKNNTIKAYQKEEQRIGNGIHCWKSDSMQIIGNRISGHRDGIYFEFVSNSVIWRNVSKANIRYGLHFMFSNDDSYIGNVFKNNGAGVAVMFTKNVKMFNNYFEENWGDAAYGLLLKEISDSYIVGNKFIRNTSGIYMEGTSRVKLEKNIFKDNGWGMKVQASCMDNEISFNNFLSNTFDISTNGSLVLNHFNNNYWDKYEGYDLNRDGIGDVPFHPLSLFAVITENNPSAMLLFRSFMITLLDKSEKILPSITPDNFVDESPEMKSLIL